MTAFVRVDKVRDKFRKPWMTPSLLKSVQKQHTYYARHKKQPFNEKLKQKHRKYKNVLTDALRTAKRLYYDETIEKIKEKPAKAKV